MAAMPSLKIDNARYVVTVDPQRRIIRDASILIEDGRISRVGKATELAGTRAERVIDARQFVVTPGFVNGHMHISYAHAVRGIFPDDAGSPLNHVFKLQMAMTEEEEYATSLLGIVELLKNGTVCFVDPGSTKFPDACLQAYEDSGIRVLMGDCVSDRDAPFPLPRYSASEAVDRTGAFIKKWHGRLNGRLRAWAMPFSPRRAAPICCAGSSGWPTSTGHRSRCTTTAGPRRERTTRSKARPVRRNIWKGSGCSDRTSCWPTCSASTTPRWTLWRAPAPRRPCVRSPRPRADAVWASTVGCPSCWPEASRSRSAATRPTTRTTSTSCARMNMAAIQYKDARQDMKQIPAETALELATLTGAQALGVGDEIGSLEPGKKADLVLFDTQRPEWQTLFNPINNLVYNADGRSIHTVIVDGRVVVDAYRQSFVDEARLFSQVQEMGEKLLARTGVSFARSRWPIV